MLVSLQAVIEKCSLKISRTRQFDTDSLWSKLRLGQKFVPSLFCTKIMIRIENLHKNFGGVRAVDNASLQISKGAITGLIGPNGAGKSTLFNCIAGLHKPTSGRILLDGEDISGLEPHLLFEKGVLRTFQLAHEFKSLTVRENLMVVPHNQAGENLLKVWFSRKLVKESEKKVSKKADEVIEFLEISSLADELAGNLSGDKKTFRTGSYHDG